MKRIFLLSLLMLPLCGHAEVFKCIDQAGRASYQDTACPETAKASTVQDKDRARRQKAERAKQLAAIRRQRALAAKVSEQPRIAP